MRSSLVVILIFSFCSMASTQEVMTKEKAVAIFLNNNFDIKLADNAVNLAVVNASKANVGFYPTVQVGGNASGDLGSSNQVFQDGREIQADANLTQVYGASLGINYNLYQGGERKYNLQKLLKSVDLMDTQKRLTIESELVNMLTIYYDAARALESYRVLEAMSNLSKERLERVQNNFEFGRGSKLDVLNAEVDFQRDEANKLNASVVYETSKRALINVLGAERSDVDFEVETVVRYSLALTADALVESAEQRNLQMSLLSQNRELLSYDLKILSARQKPIVSVNAGYDYGFQDFGDGGFFAQQSSNGVGAGLGVSWGLYDGGRIKNQKQAVRVQLEGNDLQVDQTKWMLRNQIYNLYDQYLNAKRLIDVEQSNVDASDLAFQRSREEYELGRIGQIEFRQAQINLLNAELGYQSSRYNAKVLEIQLMQLSGLLTADGYEY